MYLHNRRPKMHRLRPDFTLPQLLESALVRLLRLGGRCRALESSLRCEAHLGLEALAGGGAETHAKAGGHPDGSRCCRALSVFCEARVVEGEESVVADYPQWEGDGG